MSPSAQVTSAQLKKNIQNAKKTEKGANEVEEQVEDDEEVLHPDNGTDVSSTHLNTMNIQFEHEWLE